MFPGEKITVTKALGFHKKKRRSCLMLNRATTTQPIGVDISRQQPLIHFGHLWRFSDALEIFESMKARKVMPNHVTYSALVCWIFVLKEVIVECLLFNR